MPAMLREPAARRVLGALLLGDLVLLGMHTLQIVAQWRHAPLGDAIGVFRLETETGPGEIWEAAKTLICVVALGDAARRSRQPVHLALAFAFLVVLLDNLLKLHEAIGAALARAVAGVGGVPAAALAPLGELAAFLGEGSVIGAALVLGFAASDRRHWRAAGVAVLLLLALAVFGVGVDLLHALVKRQRWAVEIALGTLEDGGEMLLLSPAAAYAIGLARRLPAAGG